MLLQSADGKGGHVAINPEHSQIGMFNEINGEFVPFPFSLEDLTQVHGLGPTLVRDMASWLCLDETPVK